MTSLEDTMQSLPRWSLVFCIAGGKWFPDEQIEYLERDLKAIVQGQGQTLQNALGNITTSQILPLLGRHSGDPYWKYKVRGDFREIFFVTTLDRFPPFLDLVSPRGRGDRDPPRAGRGVPAADRPGQFLPLRIRHLFRPGGRERNLQSVRALFEKASSRLIEKGAFFSRPYPAWAEEVYASKAQFVTSLKKVKSVFDPNHVMNPGKLCF